MTQIGMKCNTSITQQLWNENYYAEEYYRVK